MEKKRKRTIILLLVGLAAGSVIDGLLRLNSGNDGNLLVHSVVFLVGFLLAVGIVRLIYFSKDKRDNKKDVS